MVLDGGADVGEVSTQVVQELLPVKELLLALDLQLR